jgi:hypothetical protein
MAAMAMVQAQNAKNMGGKFPKKSETFNFLIKKIKALRKITLEASNWAQNMQKDVLYPLEAEPFCCANSTLARFMLFCTCQISIFLPF